jgi:hypothetical protein
MLAAKKHDNGECDEYPFDLFEKPVSKGKKKVDGPDNSHKPGLLVGKKFACTTGRAGLAIARAYGESLAYLPTHRAPLFLCATTAFGLRKLHGQNSISGAVWAAGGIRVRTAASRGNVSFEL